MSKVKFIHCKTLLIGIIGAIGVQTIGCAAAKATETQPLHSVECEQGELRGFGTGANEGEALNAARSSLAMQVHSSIKVSSKYRQNQRVLNNEEILSSDYETVSVAEASLLNAHDARIQRTERSAHEVGMVLCMSRADAAKGFAERQRLVADSLVLAANVALGTEHPKRKNEAFARTQTLWNELARLQGIIEGFGVEKLNAFNSANEIYSKAIDDYRAYCRNQKTYWEDTESDCSKAVFSILSGKTKVEKAECQSENALKLKFACQEKCSPASFGGVQCVFEPSLSLESCGGESYSLLKTTEFPRGTNMHSAGKAKENLMEKLPSAGFFSEWEKELKGWMPQCAD